MTKQITRQQLSAALVERHGQERQQHLYTASVGIAGIGRPSQACEAMEMGAAAVMANTAIATAGDIPLMAAAFKQAVEAGRAAYLAGLGRVLEQGAAASSPLTGFLEDR